MKTAVTLTTLVLSAFLFVSSRPCRAQATSLPGNRYLLRSDDVDSSSAPDPIVSPDSPASDPAGPPAPQGAAATGATASDNQWHLSLSPYLWLPGVHGTVGAFGRDASFKASASDLLSHFRFGLLGYVEARHNRLLVPIDMMFMRLGDDKALPFPNVGANTANVKMTEFILTPKLGVRLIDGKMFKADALAGIRYWYLGENLQFSPSTLGLNFSKSQNFVDPVVGGRIEAAVSPKVVTTIAGDVGGWGTGSQLEYQVVGLLGYKLKPAMTLQAGYRYLYVDYAKSGQAAAVVKTAMSGVVLGVTLNLK
jgi:hypothetical protein